ncbi:hypothetical protein T07_2321 [Trichinella nelsoni]|uniref:Uncharacterized protein n=4 Tax=Trichinella TaxID=6333 RepID=A0A0V1LBU5_9BILA|nr:hypothetical protein T07_2321 [Trichinella nelsoni]KRY15460.1 hypothetical protein T12_1545 [Trichinella patagoniensis]KRY50990.1 hypothetical protein T03_9832 [Trichinella britovi]KRZ57012.1 hypothetical protein T02_8118 [Trichinella nativa]
MEAEQSKLGNWSNSFQRPICAAIGRSDLDNQTCRMSKKAGHSLMNAQLSTFQLGKFIANQCLFVI